MPELKGMMMLRSIVLDKALRTIFKDCKLLNGQIWTAVPNAALYGLRLVKTIKDGLNGVIWVDDSRIVNLTAMKRYDSENPRVVVRVEEVKD